MSLALACGGLAASRVREMERDVEARVGAALPVRGGHARPASPTRASGAARSAVVRVPARYVPPDALGVAWTRRRARAPATALPRGSYLTASRLRGARSGRRPGALGPGERAVDVAVAGGSALAAVPPGTRVDVLVSSEPGGGAGRTVLALEGVELLATRAGRSGGAGEGAAAAATARATLRVTVRQAVYLAAAENYAPRGAAAGAPAGRPRRAPARTAVGAGDL